MRIIIAILCLMVTCAWAQNDMYPKSDKNLVAWYGLRTLQDKISGSLATTVGAFDSTTWPDALRDSTVYRIGWWENYIKLANTSLLNNAPSASFSVWGKVLGSVGTENYSGLLYFDNKAGNFFGIQPHKDSGGNYNWWTYYSPSITNVAQTAARVYDVSTNKWMHFAVSYNGKDFTGYLNGRVVVFGPATGLVQQTTAFVIGQDPYNGGAFDNGLVDEPMIWNRALSYNEIQQLYIGRWRQTLGELSAINQGQGLGTGD